jgi:hypothetical protein
MGFVLASNGGDEGGVSRAGAVFPSDWRFVGPIDPTMFHSVAKHCALQSPDGAWSD